jgi:hypothetical protein
VTRYAEYPLRVIEHGDDDGEASWIRRSYNPPSKEQDCVESKEITSLRTLRSY